MDYLDWFTIGLILVLIEFFVPGVFMVWFGLSAFLTGILTIYFEFSTIEISVVYGLTSLGFAIIGWFAYDKIIKHTKIPEKYKNLNNPAGEFIGKSFPLDEDVKNGRSKALIGDSVWIVHCEDNLKKGDYVKITDIENGVVLVGEKKD